MTRKVVNCGTKSKMVARNGCRLYFLLFCKHIFTGELLGNAGCN